MDRNAPDPIQGVMIRGRGTDHYTSDGVGGVPSCGYSCVARFSKFGEKEKKEGQDKKTVLFGKRG